MKARFWLVMVVLMLPIWACAHTGKEAKRDSHFGLFLNHPTVFKEVQLDIKLDFPLPKTTLVYTIFVGDKISDAGIAELEEVGCEFAMNLIVLRESDRILLHFFVLPVDKFFCAWIPLDPLATEESHTLQFKETEEEN